MLTKNANQVIVWVKIYSTHHSKKITKYANKNCKLSYPLVKKEWPLSVSKAMRFSPAGCEKFHQCMRALNCFLFGIVV